jgi:hypothetical protein
MTASTVARSRAPCLDISHLGDAEHDRRKDDRGQKHLDQLDEAFCERLELCREIREHKSDDDTRADPDKYLHI